MKKVLLGVFATLASLSGIGAGAAMAEDWYTWSDGTYCYTVSCSSSGCQIIDSYPCPREVGGD